MHRQAELERLQALEAFRSKCEDREDRLVQQLQDLQQQVRKLQSRKSVEESCSKEAQPATRTQSEDKVTAIHCNVVTSVIVNIEPDVSQSANKTMSSQLLVVVEEEKGEIEPSGVTEVNSPESPKIDSIEKQTVAQELEDLQTKIPPGVAHKEQTQDATERMDMKSAVKEEPVKSVGVPVKAVTFSTPQLFKQLWPEHRKQKHTKPRAVVTHLYLRASISGTRKFSSVFGEAGCIIKSSKKQKRKWSSRTPPA